MDQTEAPWSRRSRRACFASTRIIDLSKTWGSNCKKMIDLSEKVAIVTGGASGIGRGISLVLAEQGADVVLADMNTQGAETVAADLSASGRRARAITTDVTDRKSVAGMVAQVLEEFGKVDILVNDAGVVGAPNWWEREFPNDEDWDLTLAVNLRGVVNVSEAVMGHMKERRYGKIVNIASIAARYGNVDIPHYNASKAAVVSWTQSNALQLASFDINVNAICPGVLWTPMFERIAEKRARFNTDPEFEGLEGRAFFEEMVGVVDSHEAGADARGHRQDSGVPGFGRRS